MSETQMTGQIQIPGGDAVSGLPAGSIQRLLAANLGKEVVAEFVVGMDEIVRKAGTLYAVNTDYLVLYDDVNLVDVVCDLYSLKFISFYLPGTRPDLARMGGGTSGTAMGNGTGGAANGRSGMSNNAGTGSAGSTGSGGNTGSTGNTGNAGENGHTGSAAAAASARGTAAVLAARPQSQAALNYAKRKTRKLD